MLSKTSARLADWAEWLAAPIFLGLWATTLLLQTLDVGSVALGYAVGAPIHEANPFVRTLVAREGLLVALVVKFATAAAWLVLALGVWLVCRERGWRVGMLSATLVILAAALLSAGVFWWNVAAVFFGQ